jgi:hypothetical protein
MSVTHFGMETTHSNSMALDFAMRLSLKKETLFESMDLTELVFEMILSLRGAQRKR